MAGQDKPKGLMGPLIFAVVAVGFAWAVFQIPAPPDPEPVAQSQEQVDIAVARRACRDILGQHLHDPSSAEWGNVALWPAGPDAEDPNRILVQPEIRARNAMGGLILTRFQCTFEGSGEGMRLVGVVEY